MHKALILMFFLFPADLKDKIEDASNVGDRYNQILALKTMLKDCKNYDDATAYVYYKIAHRFQNEEINEQDSAIHYYELALQCFGTDNSQKKSAKNFAYLSLLYNHKQQYLKALELLDQGKKFVDITDISPYLNTLSEIMITSNNTLFNIDLLKFQKAVIEYTQTESEEIAYKNIKKLSRQEALNKNKISIDLLKEALANFEESTVQTTNKFDCYNELGIRYQEFGDYKNAEYYYNKLKEDTSSIYQILYHNNIADLYTTTKKYKLSAYHRRIARQLLLADTASTPNSIALNLIGFANLKKEMQQLDSALFYVNKALATYPIDKAGFDNTEFLNDICERKIQKYDIHHLINKNYFNINELDEIDTIIDALRKKQTDEASKADIRATAIDFYKRATLDCINNKQEKKALYFKEKAKSILLVENYLQLTNEKEILDFKYAVEAILNSPNPDTVDFIQTFEKLKPVLSLLVKKYESNQSVNKEVFYDAIEKSISQNPKDHAYLDYFETEDEMLVFKITNKVDIYRLHLNPQIKESVTAYKDSIIKKGELHLGPSIYKAIVEPLGLLPQNITIIPDSYLSYLPFEALHTGKHEDDEDLKSYDFLIKHYNIDYNYSLGMAALMRDKKINSKGTHVFLPNFESSSNDKDYADERQMLIPLQYAKEEAAAINRLYKTAFFENQAANKVAFIRSLGTANVIHFAGHAIINNENHHLSYLAFDAKEKDESRLYLKDIVGVSTNADLIVLSACQTAAGKYAAGEGFLSLGRAMVACGSKSIVTSLWNVFDSSGSSIIEGFYKNLKDGQSKSNALHHSKLKFINNASHNELAHPYYWSAFVFVGNNTPLNQSSIDWKLLLMSLVGTSILAFSFLSFRKKK